MGTTPVSAKQGRANLFLRDRNTQQTTAAATVGDVLSLELYIQGNQEQVTGIDLFLSFDDSYLELIPTKTGQPFADGGYLGVSAPVNNTQGDVIGNSDANKIPGFQLHYSADIPAPIGSGQRFVSGNGVIATFSLRVTHNPGNGASVVSVVNASPSGGQTGYYVNGDPGTIYAFNSITSLSIDIQGFNASLDLPDLYLLPGKVDSTLNLSDSIDDPANPDSTLTWAADVLGADSLQVTINPKSTRVLVDPRIVQGTDTTSFIGVRQVKFSVTTRYDQTASDTIKVTVDTPPKFVTAAIPDTVRFWEDRDTTFTLTARDPDRGAQLTFTPVDTLSNILAFFDTQSAADDTVRQVVRMSAKPNFFGAGKKRFLVKDQFGLTDTVAVQMVVKPVNDPPEFIKAFPEITVDAVGQASLNLADYVRDVDDPFDKLQFAFTGVDSIAFAVTAGNQKLVITPVPPFQGTRTANVVVTDTSNAAAIQRITVHVNPPQDAQPPHVTVPSLKVGVRAGAAATTVDLDTLVSDIDTPVDRLTWSRGPVSRVQVDAAALANRQLQVSAPADSTGFQRMTLRVTDPTQLSDSLAVRIYSSSAVTGLPVAGGLPDLAIVIGQADTLDLDDYYFDADNTDNQVTWTATGQQDVAVAIDPATHQTVLSPKSGATHLVEDIVFTVRDPDGHTAADTMRVSILDPGSVLLNVGAIGGKVGLKLGQVDTLALTPLIRVGDVNHITWKATSRNISQVFSQVIGQSLLLIGVRVGSTQVVLTATDTTSGKSATDSLQVDVSANTQADTLVVRDIGPLVLTAGRDTTLNLATLVVASNAPSLVWTVADNANIGVEINAQTQTALLHANEDFSGNAGPLVFTARDPVSGKTATSVASPVTVLASGANLTGLLKISVIINPVLKNYLNVFVYSQRVLLSSPFLNVRAGVDPSLPSTQISVDPVASVANMWVGDLRLDTAITGIVELTATGVSQDTHIALTDTLRLRIDQATVSSSFSLSQGEVSVTLPAGGVDAPSVVALIPERRTAALAKPAAEGLVPISDTYTIYAPDARVQRPGEIAFSVDGAQAQAGVYRWDDAVGQWVWVGGEYRNGQLVGAFDAFGRYGAFIDLNRKTNLALHQNFPNPFNPQTTIRFDMPDAGAVRLCVYNALGQTVRTLVAGVLSGGQHAVVWDARDDAGQHVGAGLYVYRLEVDGRALARKMLLLK